MDPVSRLCATERFLACCAEAGFPGQVLRSLPPIPSYPRGGVLVSFDPPIPAALGVRARELAGLSFAHAHAVVEVVGEDDDPPRADWRWIEVTVLQP